MSKFCNPKMAVKKGTEVKQKDKRKGIAKTLQILLDYMNEDEHELNQDSKNIGKNVAKPSSSGYMESQHSDSMNNPVSFVKRKPLTVPLVTKTIKKVSKQIKQLPTSAAHNIPKNVPTIFFKSGSSIIRQNFPLDSKYTCKLCHKGFEEQINLQFHNLFDHRGLKTSNENADFVGHPAYCSTCNRFYKSQNDIDVHNYYKHNARLNQLDCVVCGFKCLDVLEKTKHYKEKHFDFLERKYKCVKCTRLCVDLKGLVHHQISHIQFMKEIQCVHCNHSRFFEKALDDHIKDHKSDDLLVCKICSSRSKKYPDKQSLQKHLTLHLQTILDSFPSVEYIPTETEDCVEKETSFNSDNPTSEESVVKLDDEMYDMEIAIIDEDNVNNKEEKDLNIEPKEHEFNLDNEEINDDQEPIIETREDEYFSDDSIDNLLIKKEYSSNDSSDSSRDDIFFDFKNKQLYSCTLCGLAFMKDRDRVHHQRTVHFDKESKKFKCPKCPVQQVNLLYLLSHFETHNFEDGITIICELCGKGFALKSTYKSHYSRIHADPGIDHKCEICNKIFRKQYLLANHLKRHTGERPYKCTECPAAYKESVDLRRHRYSHGGFEKTVECLACSQKFYDRRGLRTHMRYKHGFVNNLDN